MDELEEILSLPPDEAVVLLMEKTVDVPEWKTLVSAYDVSNHPVNDTSRYPDEPEKDDYMTRITYNLAKIAASRMAGLCCGIPVNRIYSIERDDQGNENEDQLQARKVIEKIYKANRIASADIQRWKKYFAGCEILTLWYATEVKNPHTKYGVESKYKVRCRTYSPMDDYEIYPMFDSFGDYIAVSIKSTATEDDLEVTYLDVYTDTEHILYTNRGEWVEENREAIIIEKNPTLYAYREQAIYEDAMNKVYEMEWSTSRAGNYLRKNTAPIFGVFADEVVKYGDEKQDNNSGDKRVMQYPQGSDARYITWQLNQGALEFYNSELRRLFFTEIQVPDFSYENMKQLQLSGEAFKQVFVDATLKVIEESGAMMEFLGREYNVVKEFAKIVAPDLAEAIDSLDAEIEITPFTVTSENDRINNIYTATGGKPIISQEEGVALGGLSRDVQATMRKLERESKESSLTQAE